MLDTFISRIGNSIRTGWDRPALKDFRKDGLTYGQFASELLRLQLLWENAGLQKGDKIAICARSCSNWLKVFHAGVTGGYVSVQLFNGFTPSDVMGLVNHSDSRILYTEKAIFDKMDFSQMPQVIGVVDTLTMELLASREGFEKVYGSLDEAFAKEYPHGVSPEDVNLTDRDMDDVCAIMYTSGSTGSPKGVMLTVRNFSTNVDSVIDLVPFRRGTPYVSLLPFAHIFGLTCDGIIPFTMGMSVTVLVIPPIPSNVKDIMMEVKPNIFFAVPLILSKFVDYAVGDLISCDAGKKRLADYQNNPEYCRMLHDIIFRYLGGNIEVFLTGGAAIPSELESLLAFKIGLPFATGYGMTETAPVLSVGQLGAYKPKSCGLLNEKYMEYRIDSPDPEHIAGELQCRGGEVFAGYYKNPEATSRTFTEDGWFRTGDLGTIDADRNLFLVGRCKSMILSTNGQNIFPEEIEVILNELPYVAESVVVARGQRLVAIIVPDADAAAHSDIDADSLYELMKQNVAVLNSRIPQYSQVAEFELRYEPFAKTPKGSIKRFMYC